MKTRTNLQKGAKGDQEVPQISQVATITIPESPAEIGRLYDYDTKVHRQRVEVIPERHTQKFLIVALPSKNLASPMVRQQIKQG